MQSFVTNKTPRTVEEMLAHEDVRRAFRFFETQSKEITQEQVTICEIPAPPFEERERATYVAKKFKELGLSEVTIDEEGNCIGVRKGQSDGPTLVVSAHLDTVFPAGTDVKVRTVGNKLLAPGISDDGCGLAAMIALARALQDVGIETEGSLLFVGTVGEEGEGNLRGVRHLFTEGRWAKSIDAFISFDGAGAERITNQALGSRRYHVKMNGTGGHSWSDFGIANPVHALGRAIAKLVSYPIPSEPRTTFNVGRIQGGASVNSIPTEASMDVDLRSGAQDELLRLDAFFRRAIREAVDDENASQLRSNQPLQLTLQLIGERPGGETPVVNPLVDLALAATRSLGFTPHLEQASTDSNLPISLGIPAITLGAGGTSGNSHTLDEWYDPTGRDLGLKRALLVTLGTVGIHEK